MSVDVDAAAVPDALISRENWVCWRLETRDGKETKVPIDPHTGDMARSDAPETWGSFETATARDDVNGVGLMMHGSDTLAAVDFDDVREVDPETGDVTVSEWAGEAIHALDSYTEVSPSGTGFHTWVFGFKGGDRCKTGVENGEDIELYDHGDNRFLTVTGDRCDEPPETVEHRNDAFRDLYREHFEDDDPKTSTAGGEADPEPTDLSDDDLLRKARNAENGPDFTDLWMGDISGHPSHSEADLALANHLAFWTGGDRSRMDRLFRDSGLMRDKWDRDDYREETIDKALSGQGSDDYYSPDHHSEGDDSDPRDMAGDAVDDALAAIDEADSFTTEAAAVETFAEELAAAQRAGLKRSLVGGFVREVADETRTSIPDLEDMVDEATGGGGDDENNYPPLDEWLDENVDQVSVHRTTDHIQDTTYRFRFTGGEVVISHATRDGRTHNSWTQMVDEVFDATGDMVAPPRSGLRDTTAWMSWMREFIDERGEDSETEGPRSAVVRSLRNRIEMARGTGELLDLLRHSAVWIDDNPETGDPSEIWIPNHWGVELADSNGTTPKKVVHELAERGHTVPGARGCSHSTKVNGRDITVWKLSADFEMPLSYHPDGVPDAAEQVRMEMDNHGRTSKDDELFGDGPGGMRRLSGDE
jgi:hypothetical protein